MGLRSRNAPQGGTSLSRTKHRWKTGTLRFRRCAPRAPRFAQRHRCLELQLTRLPLSADSKPWTRRFRPMGPVGTAA
eukprot:15440382-Alexandrium_andersonii.AAC.1